MILQIKVKVKLSTLKEFAEKLMSGQLDRSAIISEAYCEKDDPSVGISYWQVEDMDEFQEKFTGWNTYYESAEIKEVVSAKQAMMMLFSKPA